jgi:2-amino-4-hydroxy-6-hydroxymethyldihydropteridine diphosphokinase
MDQRSATTTAFLGLGANLGDRRATLAVARSALAAAAGVHRVAASALYETAPVGGPAGQPAYLNAVLRLETTLPARQLLALCLATEAAFGRRRDERWGARTLDLDLLLYGAAVLDEPELVVPHPELHRRRFVLVPLAGLAPELLHPRLGKTVRELLTDSPAGEVRLLAETW